MQLRPVNSFPSDYELDEGAYLLLRTVLVYNLCNSIIHDHVKYLLG